MSGSRLLVRLVMFMLVGGAIALILSRVVSDTDGVVHQAVGIFISLVAWFGYECIGIMLDRTIFKGEV